MFFSYVWWRFASFFIYFFLPTHKYRTHLLIQVDNHHRETRRPIQKRYQNYLTGRVCVTADSTVFVNQPTSSYGPRNGFARINIITFACCHFRAPESLDFQGPPLPMALVMALVASKQCKQQLHLYMYSM